jgi:hypothetical protein
VIAEACGLRGNRSEFFFPVKSVDGRIMARIFLNAFPGRTAARTAAVQTRGPGAARMDSGTAVHRCALHRIRGSASLNRAE